MLHWLFKAFYAVQSFWVVPQVGVYLLLIGGLYYVPPLDRLKRNLVNTPETYPGNLEFLVYTGNLSSWMATMAENIQCM
jgi:hypothetical protein